MNPPIVNLADLDLMPTGHGAPPMPGAGTPREVYQARIGQVGARIGARDLGCNLTVVPAGKRAFPFHNHRANEEMFVILEGTGEIRIGSERFPVRGGDVIACPAGGTETAHQIINTSDAELRYLALSTKRSPEVAEYPDTGRFGIIAVGPDGAPMLRVMSRAETGLDYWDGE